jgi:hypothetical protein
LLGDSDLKRVDGNIEGIMWTKFIWVNRLPCVVAVLDVMTLLTLSASDQRSQLTSDRRLASVTFQCVKKNLKLTADLTLNDD